MISKRLEEIRIKNKLSKKEFAEKIEISPAQITRYNQKKQNISSKTIIKLCKVFNVSADYLLGLKENIN